MSRYIQRSDIVDYQTYEDIRKEVRDHILGVKKVRRIHLGHHLTFLFENRETLTYQVQEIMRAERIARESAILEEISGYNAMLGDQGELGCALLIEIEHAKDRKPLLKRWLGLEATLYVRDEAGAKHYATYDPSQVGTDRISAVQYLRFRCPAAPVAVGCDFDDDMAGEVELTSDQRAALTLDLTAPA